MRTVGTDLDGCVTRGVEEYMLSELNKKYGGNKTWDDFPSYSFRDVFPTTREELNDILVRCPYERLRLIDGAKESLQELKKHNNIAIITKRILEAPDIYERTFKFLKENDIPFDLLILPNPPEYDKGKIAEMLDLAFLVEDSPKNSLDAAKLGIKTYLIDYQYNQEVKHENIKRVADWEEILDDHYNVNDMEEEDGVWRKKRE